MAIATTTALAIAAVASASISAVGIYQQGKARRKMAEFNAKVADNNAKVQRNNAIAVQQDAFKAAQQRRRVGRRIAASQRVAAFKGGTTLSGSVADIMNDSALQVEEDALNEIYRGRVASSSFRNRAAGAEADATLNRMSGRAAENAATFQAAGTLASGIGQGIGYAGMKTPTS